MKMGKLNMNNLLPPSLKPTTDQSNKKKQGPVDLGGRPTKYGYARPRDTLL